MFGLFKKKMTDDEVADVLIGVWLMSSEDLYNVYLELFNLDEKIKHYRLSFEIRIFSLWLVLLSIANASQEFKKLLLVKACKTLHDNDDKEGMDYFLSACHNRYPKYDYTFNLWTQNHQSLRFFEAMQVIIEGKNRNWDPKTEVVISDILLSLNYSLLFNVGFDTIMKTIGNLRKKIKSSILNT